MASHQPGSCCVQGVKHEGTAVGETKNIGDISTYFSYPKDKSTDNAILILTDVFGHNFINPQLVADQFAANGYFVVMPDLFSGDAIPEGALNSGDFDLPKWLQGHQAKEVDPIIDTVLVEMRTKYNVKKIGAAGYCFGGKYVVRHLRPQDGKIDVGYSAHPSFVDEEELSEIKGPFSISAAETDQIFPAEKRHKSEEILAKCGQPYQMNLFSGVQHGFAIRCDVKDKTQKFAKEGAFIQAVQWFDEYMK